MKTFLSLARALPIAAAIAASSMLVCNPAVAARGGASHFSGGGHFGGASHFGTGGGWRGGPGHYRGGRWGHRGYWPGAFWGGVGLGVGLGAIGYYGGYYDGYYAPYGAYYYDPPVVVAPVYGTVDPDAPRIGQPVPQISSAAEPIFYPKNGQSAEATESDRRECNRWATTQRNAMADASVFQRATLACMEGRGYTVR